ncbi:MAG: glycosyltransferase family 4 protein [Candidatus Omnitrophica bacterium]|nr:glycosyltransferase family 4 protein [Candidatus Omnitrophota bacterium]
MNILFIANHLNVGGISSYLLTLGSGLKERGHNVYVASSGGSLVDKFKKSGITHIRVPLRTKKEVSPKIIISFLKLSGKVRKLSIDVLHSNSRTTQVLGDLLSRYNKGIAHVFTCHGFFKPKLSRRLFPCWGKAVIAISSQVKEHLLQDFKLDEKKISVINNGIDTAGFGDFSAREKTRRKLGVNDAFLVGIIARLSDVKGHTYLIQAMQIVLKDCPSAKLLIVGEGKAGRALVEQVNDLGIRDKVIFLAQAQNNRDILSAMDVFVMPSLQEGLGLALMEAMAQGLAVVGSSVGGIKTLIRDRENGLLVRPADSAGLARAIIKLFSDQPLRGELGIKARKFIMDNFPAAKMADETERVYKKCLRIKD